VHTLSLAINALLVATRATSTSDNEREIVDLTKKFIEAASYVSSLLSLSPLASFPR
jgi:hypothetical protein